MFVVRLQLYITCSIIFLHIAGRQEFRGGGDLRERLDRMRSPLHDSPGGRDAKARHTSHGKWHIFLFWSCFAMTLSWSSNLFDFTFCSNNLQEIVLALLGRGCKFSNFFCFHPRYTHMSSGCSNNMESSYLFGWLNWCLQMASSSMLYV